MQSARSSHHDSMRRLNVNESKEFLKQTNELACVLLPHPICGRLCSRLQKNYQQLSIVSTATYCISTQQLPSNRTTHIAPGYYTFSAQVGGPDLLDALRRN